MGFLSRLFGKRKDGSSLASRPSSATAKAPFGGLEPLEVVGESFYQEGIRSMVGRSGTYVRIAVVATLLAESNNPHDQNAISVWISGSQVGHLSRGDAAKLRPGLLALEQKFGGGITLPGVVVGGGEGRPSYGVFLNYSPEAFGLQRSNFRAGQARSSTLYGGVRTGLSEAIGDDLRNDTYDLSWQERVPTDRVGATTFLKQELLSETSPIGRHFLYAALEHRLYELRDEQASALSEYDATCESHHSEMPAIRAALIEELGGVPLIEIVRPPENWSSFCESP